MTQAEGEQQPGGSAERAEQRGEQYPPPGLPPPGFPPPPPGFPPPPSPGFPPPPAGFLPPVRRRPLALRLVLLFTVLVVLCGTPAVWAFVRYAPTLARPELRPDGAGSASTTPSGPRSPRPGDPADVQAAWVGVRIDAALAAQGAALLRGDEAGFLAAGEAGNVAVRTELTRRFRSLRALQVTRWEPRLASLPRPEAVSGGRSQWRARLLLRHCFVVPTCEQDALRVESHWVERDGRARLVGLDATGADQNGPRPWEVGELKVAVGKRAVVATTARYAARLRSLLGEAERAATVADRFVVGTVPDRYYLFLAGAAEWKQWYSGNRPEWAAGYAVPVGEARIDVVLNAGQTPSNFLDDIMRHELSHVASLRGAEHQSANWWLIEGLAEHAELYGRSASQHDAVSSGAVRRFIRSGKWDGTVRVTEPAASAALQEAGARYGIAFLAVRRLVERYGEAKLLAFFKAVMHDGKTTDAASPEVLGAPWTAVQADCVSYLRRMAG